MQQISASPSEPKRQGSVMDDGPMQPRSRHYRSFRVIMALILRETGSRETRTSLGFLWTFIEPVLSVLILSLAFSVMSRTPPLGTNFELYYVTGVVPFQLYGQVASTVAGSIRFSANLLGFPSVTVIDVILARFLLNVFTNIVVFVILIVGTVWAYGLRVDPDYAAILQSLCMASALGLGIGACNAVLFLLSPTYQTFWGVINRPMSILAGVMFPISRLSPKVFSYLVWLPQTHVVGQMRAAYFQSFDGSFLSPGYVYLVSGITFTIGLVGLHRYIFDLLEKR